MLCYVKLKTKKAMSDWKNRSCIPHPPNYCVFFIISSLRAWRTTLGRWFITNFGSLPHDRWKTESSNNISKICYDTIQMKPYALRLMTGPVDVHSVPSGSLEVTLRAGWLGVSSYCSVFTSSSNLPGQGRVRLPLLKYECSYLRTF